MKIKTIYNLLGGVVAVFILVKACIVLSEPDKTEEERIRSAQQQFYFVKSDYAAIVQETKNKGIEGYFQMQKRLNREDVYHIFDVYDNDLTFEYPYSSIHKDLREKYGARVPYLYFMRGQLIFYGLGISILYSELSFDEIQNRYCGSNTLELCYSPDMPTQKDYWLCELSKNWYIVGFDLSCDIELYESKVAKGLIIEEPKSSNVEIDSTCNTKDAL